MKKVLLSAVLLCSGVLGYAQLLNVQSIEKIALPQGVTINKATISPEGDFVVMAQNEKSGIHRFDLATKSIATISESGKCRVQVDIVNCTMQILEFTGVEGITIDNNANSTYYNLQGVKIANPANGTYIKVEGNKSSKVYIK